MTPEEFLKLSEEMILALKQVQASPSREMLENAIEQARILLAAFRLVEDQWSVFYPTADQRQLHWLYKMQFNVLEGMISMLSSWDEPLLARSSSLRLISQNIDIWKDFVFRSKAQL